LCPRSQLAANSRSLLGLVVDGEDKRFSCPSNSVSLLGSSRDSYLVLALSRLAIECRQGQVVVSLSCTCGSVVVARDDEEIVRNIVQTRASSVSANSRSLLGLVVDGEDKRFSCPSNSVSLLGSSRDSYLVLALDEKIVRNIVQTRAVLGSRFSCSSTAMIRRSSTKVVQRWLEPLLVDY
jgi:hypothetical protein